MKNEANGKMNVPVVNITVLSDDSTFNRPQNDALRLLIDRLVHDGNLVMLGREGGAAIMPALLETSMEESLCVPVLDVLASMTCPVIDIINRNNGALYMTISMLPTLEANNRFMSFKVSGLPIVYMEAPNFTELTGSQLAQLAFFILAPIMVRKNEEDMDDTLYELVNGHDCKIDFSNLDKAEGVFNSNDR